MRVTTPYVIDTGYISVRRGSVHSGSLNTYTYNVGYYDDTKLVAYINELAADVDSIAQSQSDLINTLNSYATKTWVENKNYLTSIPSEYITESELNDTLNAASYATPLSQAEMDELFPIEK